MKRFFLTTLTAFLFVPLLIAQTVDSIKVEQAGELIKIHYKILNSNQYQTFKVSVSAKINGGLESKLESLIGDVGENIIGGKPGYIVIWDVLKDVEEVNSVDFSVRAELLTDVTPNAVNGKEKWEKKKIHLLISGGEGAGVHYGIRAAYMGSWGVSVKYLVGKYDDYNIAQESYFHRSIDVTKRVISTRGFQAHLLAGIANGKLHTEEVSNPWVSRFSYEVGTIIGMGPVVISWAITPGYKNHTYRLDAKVYTNWGIGIRF